MKDNRKDLTPPYFRYLVHVIRPFPNFDPPFIKPVRQKAVEVLHLNRAIVFSIWVAGRAGVFPTSLVP